jgi:endonuclease YncB( thermonuclease family)
MFIFRQIFQIFLVTGLVAIASSAFALEKHEGSPSIKDGDSLSIDGKKIRLHGVDAPETDQLCVNEGSSLYPCGIAARAYLARLVRVSRIVCSGSEYDQYERLIAKCYSGKVDLSAEMVRAGWGLAYIRYSKNYMSEEKEARSRMAGMWSGAFFAPWDWRKRNLKTEVLAVNLVPIKAQRLLLDTLSPYRPLVAGCDIKGIFSKKGERVYYLKNDRNYQKIRMDFTERRWFCTVDEAEVAGWRSAKQKN